MYYIRKPARNGGGAGKRRSFRIALREPGRPEKTIQSEALDSLNANYQSGLVSYEKALALVRQMVEKLDPKPIVVSHSDNLRILEKYWKEVYSDRDLINPDSMYTDLRNSVESLGNLSMLTASKEEMHAALREKFSNRPNKHRRVVTRLNQLLAYAGRDVKLVKMREEFHEVRHLTLREFDKMEKHLPEDLALLCRVALYTGMRLGECFAITRRDLVGDTIRVQFQIDDTGRRRQTKTRKIRSTLIIPGGLGAVEQWLDLPAARKSALRRSNHARAVATAAEKCLKRKLVFHDLRHSYAIHLLGRGVSISLISRFLGNSVLVCERYYLGYVQSDDGADLARKLLSS